ncbi:MAG TPA: alpha/beta hydrolase [Gemmatimonadaceae bacterium]|jgi:pimeloyl-ACP methyl ester carboxylesterase
MTRLLALCLLLLAACRPADRAAETTATASGWRDAATHRERFVETNGVRLDVLDWGGTGPALILIHGYGDSPHVFDDIAPKFTDQFRVVAYARRGHGKSSSGESYSNATLVADLVGIMDSLGIAKASLAGWSMGGNEITAAAGLHPDRVEKLVYLDAGYDWSDTAFAASLGELPIALDPPAEAKASLDAFKAWWIPTWWPGGDVARVEAFLRDISGLASDGTLHPVPDSANAARAFAALLSERRDYRKVHAPALAIYAEIFLSQPGKHSAASAAIRGWETKHAVPFRAVSQARLRKDLRGAEIVTVPGSHADFIFVSRDTIATLMSRFLMRR